MAMDNPTIEKANDALIALSRDPKAPAIAQRRDQIRLHQVELTAAQERAREEGQRTEAAHAIRAICMAFTIELTTEREQFLNSATIEQLKTLRDVILESRVWPQP